MILWQFLYIYVDAMDLDQTQAIYDLTEEEEEEERIESERDVKKEVNIFEESWEGRICNLLANSCTK